MKSASHGLTHGLILTLAFLSAVGPFAADLYLPAFTDISRELGAAPSGVQLTLTAFMVGLGVGQLYLGPLSDRLGRRRVLIVSLGAFTVASYVMVFSPTIEIFIALRLVQGVVGASGLVISRAIIADLAKGAAAIRALSLLGMIVALAPVIAPISGGFLTEFFGWRGVLAVLAGITSLMFLLALLFVPETLPPDQRHLGGARRALKNFARLARTRDYMLIVLAQALNFGAFLGYIAAAPFVGQTMLGMSPSQFSFAFAASAFAMVVANSVNAKLAGRVRPTSMLLIGTGMVATAGGVLAILAIVDALTIPLFVGCAFVLSGGTALVSANSTALALGFADFARGSGSAMLGAIQFTAASIAPPIVGAWGDQTALPMALTVLVGSLSSFCLALVASRLLPRNG